MTAGKDRAPFTHTMNKQNVTQILFGDEIILTVY